MSKNQNNIPELRFPEFNDSLLFKKMKNFGHFVGGGTPSRNVKKYWEGNIPWISSSDLSEDNLNSINVTRYINENAIKNSATKLIPKDSVLFISRVGVGKIAVNNFEVCTSQDFTNFIPKESNAHFIGYYFLSKKNLLLSNSQGTSIKGFTKGDIESIKIKLPTLPEQQKIATFLTSVDKRIQALEQKKELLEQYKKGVMQKIFNQEIRFQPHSNPQEETSQLAQAAEPATPYGNNHYPDWEVKKLGEIGSTYNGLTGKSKEDFGSGKPYIQYKQIFDNSKIDITKVDYVNITVKDQQNRAKFGDIFFTTSSETPNEIGTSSVLLEDLEEIYLNSFCFGFRPKSLQMLDPHFSRYLFRSETFRKKIIKLAQGSTRYNMSKVQLLKLKVELPCLEEQQKIAGFLSALDVKITTLQTQIDQHTSWKKGLLQKMFC